MPTFDFRCKKCETVFEFSRPFGSTTVPPCPACKSKATEKLLGAPGVVFKGTGWYKTDSRGPSSPAAPAASSTPEKKADAADTPAPTADAAKPAPQKSEKKAKKED